MHEDYISVNDFLDSLNESLENLGARVIGEITEVQLYPDRNYLFFKIKDKDNAAVLTCFMSKYAYRVSGVELEVGLEVVVSGTPGIYKPYGRFSFNVDAVELVGEGQLKKAYDELKVKLEKEGVFSKDRKRELPLLPQKIGLITSKDGAAIGDFQVNLGRFGFKITFIDSRVEGQLAVPELLSAIRTFRNKDIEVLVLVRGGGSLESLLSFNNEALVREIVDFPVPVLVGVGHERDISLAALAADKMVSTPTATAQALNESWQQAAGEVQYKQRQIFDSFDRALASRISWVEGSFRRMRENLQSIFQDFHQVENSFDRVTDTIGSRIAELHRQIDAYPTSLSRFMRALLQRTQTYIFGIEKLLTVHNPERQLKLGYSIVSSNEGIVRSIKQIQKGQAVDIRVQDGSFKSDVTQINKNV